MIIRLKVTERTRRFVPIFCLTALAGLLALTLFDTMLRGRAISAMSFAEGQHLALNLMCIALVGAASWRFSGSMDERLTKLFGTAILVHGLFAFLILVGRWYFDRPILILSFLASLVFALSICVYRYRTNRPRVVVVGPHSAATTYSLGDRIVDPSANLGAYDIVLMDFGGPVDPEWNKSLARATLSGCVVRHIEEYVEEYCGTVSLEHFDLHHVTDRNDRFYPLRKRIMDIVGAATLLVAMLPICLTAALAIFISSGWPIFFVQERVGRGGAPFRMWKLRTMRAALPDEAVRAATRGDSRVTPVGSFLRRTRIDELPQLWNVLRGDMSLVGPRPEAVELHLSYAAHTPAYIYRNLVRPGITGWAQVSTTPSSNPDEARRKLRYDLYYVKRCSILLDLRILSRTFGALLRGIEMAPSRGAREFDVPTGASAEVNLKS